MPEIAIQASTILPIIARGVSTGSAVNTAHVYHAAAFVKQIINNLLPMHHFSLDEAIKSSNTASDFLAKLKVDNLENSDRVILAFQILHPEKGGNVILADEDFRPLRRAIGNGNYPKAFNLLANYLKADSSREKRILMAAALIGSLKAANKDYINFLKEVGI